MANQKELVFKLKFVDENGQLVEKTAQNITDINKSIKDLKSELENTELGSEQWNNLAGDLGKAENALGSVNEATKKAKESQQTLGQTLSGLPGPIGQTIQGAKSLNASLLKLVMNPIGAVIAAITLALTALYKAFTSTKAGGEAVEQVMAGLSAVFDVLRDRVLKIGGALVKFLSGDFAGAAEDVKGAFTGVGDEIASEFQEAAKLTKELQAITDAERALTQTRAEQNKEIAKAKLIINDETKSYGERQAALDQVRKAEIALSKQEEILAQRKYDAIKAQNALSDSSKEALDAEAAAFAALQQAQTASLQKQKEIFDQQKALRDKERAEQKAAAEKRKAELKTLRDFEEGLNLEAIRDADERALKELEIAKRNQVEQLKELGLGKKKQAELLVQIEENYQAKRLQIETDSYAKSVETITAFRNFLIQNQIQGDQTRLELEGIFYAESLKELDDYVNGQKSSYEEDIKNRKSAFNDAEEDLESLKKAYSDLFNTQKFEAQQALSADLANGDKREEERQKQLSEIQSTFDKEYEIRRKAIETNVSDEVQRQKQLSELAFNEYDERNRRISEINTYFDQYEINRVEQFNAEITKLTKERVEKEKAAEKSLSDAKQKLKDQERAAQNASLQLAADGFGVLQELAGDNFELAQAAAYGQTIISTYQAAQAAYASQLTIPTPDAPVRAAVAAGIAVAQGIARAIAIANTERPQTAADGMVVGQGSGRLDNIPVMVSNGETIVNARSSKMFRPLLSAINQAGGGRRFANGGVVGMTTQTSPETSLLNNIANISSQSPIKTYVVASEVSTNASLDRQIKSRSVL
jgi:hypothetical protein